MLKTHHKIICCNREFPYLPAKIIGKIVKYQYLPTRTIHFSLSHLTLSSLSHIPLSSLLLALIPLSITLCHSWTALIWIYSHAPLQRAELEADYSSVHPCVRASVHPPPRGSSKPMLLHHTVWNFRKSPMYREADYRGRGARFIPCFMSRFIRKGELVLFIRKICRFIRVIRYAAHFTLNVLTP